VPLIALGGSTDASADNLTVLSLHDESSSLGKSCRLNQEYDGARLCAWNVATCNVHKPYLPEYGQLTGSCCRARADFCGRGRVCWS